jgi:predicted outer membrane lipoprotein
MTLAFAVLTALAAQEQVDNPQYGLWKGFKLGSWVKHKMVMDAGGRIVETEVTATLVESTAEKVVLESKTVMNFGGQRMEMQPTKKDVLAKMKKEGQGAVSEKDEDVTIEGKTYKCRAMAWEHTEKGQTMKGTAFVCTDVPGGMVKSEMNSAQLPKPIVLTLLAFEKK